MILFGYGLIALSAGLLALHWQAWREAAPTRGEFESRQLNRRSQASALIGVVGVAVALFEQIPRRPWPFAIYAACLVIATGIILWLAFADVIASRQQEHEQRMSDLAEALNEQLAEREEQ